MGHIKTKELTSGKKAYLARWIAPDGKEKSQQFTRKGDAQRHLDNVEGSKARGVYLDPRAGEVTVREYFETWNANALSVRRALTNVNVSGNFRNHILPAIGDRRIASIRRSDVQGIVTALVVKGLKGSTIRVVMVHVKALFAAAVLDRVIPESPYVRIQLPDTSTGPISVPTVAQIHAIATALPAHMRAMPVIAAGTGLRISELVGMTLDNVNESERTITVPERDAQLCFDRTTSPATPYLGPPKSLAGARTIPVGFTVVKALNDHLADHGGKVEIRGQDGNVSVRHMVFTLPSEAPFYRTHAGREIAKATEGMNLPPRSAWHSFRHFYASALIQAGEDPKTIQTRMGHGSITETFDTYGHLFPDTEDRSRRAIDDAFAKGEQ